MRYGSARVTFRRGPLTGRTRPRHDAPLAWPWSWRDGVYNNSLGFPSLVRVRARRPQTNVLKQAECRYVPNICPQSVEGSAGLSRFAVRCHQEEV